MKRSNCKEEINNEICLFISQNKLKIIIVIIVNLIFIITCDVKQIQIKRTENTVDMLFLKKIDEKIVEELFDVEDFILFYNVIT